MNTNECALNSQCIHYEFTCVQPNTIFHVARAELALNRNQQRPTNKPQHVTLTTTNDATTTLTAICPLDEFKMPITQTTTRRGTWQSASYPRIQDSSGHPARTAFILRRPQSLSALHVHVNVNCHQRTTFRNHVLVRRLRSI